MQTKQIGTSDLNVSKICLGTMTWGEQNAESEAFQQLDYALDVGINFLDTAEVYAVPPRPETQGLTETFIGNWIKKTNRRDEWVIATKMAGKEVPWIRDGRGFMSNDIETAIDGSLQRLQTDVIDLYQLHWPQRPVQKWGKQNFDSNMLVENADTQLSSFYQSLSQAVQKGKIRYIGLSNETPWGVMQYQKYAEHYHLPPIVSIQNAYSMLRREYEVGLSEISLYENISLLAYSPLAGGLLSGKYQNQAMPANSRFALFPSMMGYYANPRTEQALVHYQKMADELGISLTQLALAFVNDQAFVASNIIGATTLSQLKENVSSADITLPQATLEAINQCFIDFPNPGNY